MMKTQEIKPDITVILPVYNAEQYLYDTLVSLTNQTYKNFIILAINDGSTDSSLKILTDYSKIEPRLKIISRKNKKLIATLNEGIDLTTTEYLARMDADDIALPCRLEHQLDYLKRNNLDICGTWAQCFGNSSKILKKPIDNDDIALYCLFYSPILHPTVIGKTEVFKLHKYDSEDLHVEDRGLWSRLLVYGYKFGNVPEILVKYRVSNNQICSKYADIQKENSIRIKKWYRDNHVDFHLIGLPDLPLTLKTIDANQLWQSIFVLNKLKKIYTNEYSLHILNIMIFKTILNGSCIGLNKVLRCLKSCCDLTFKEKCILVISALLKLSLYKEQIKQNKYLLMLISKFIDFSL